jgi:1-phosphofructokinase family hexose kinase
LAAFLAGRAGPVWATGFLGRDNAAPFAALFRERGIEDRCVRVAGETRANLKVLHGAEVTDLNLPGVQVDAQAWAALLRAVHALVEPGRWFVLAGSLPTGAPEDAYAQLVRLLRGAGCPVALDASGEAMRLGVQEGPQLIKPNLRELEELVGRRLSSRALVLEAARALVAKGIRRVVVSLGAEGSLLVEQGLALHAQPPSTPVLSTVGAGDALLSGVLTGMLRGESAEACLRRGTAFAVGTLTRPGPTLPPDAELESLGAQVRVEEAR